MRKLGIPGRADVSVLSPTPNPLAEKFVVLAPRFTGRDSVTIRPDCIRSLRVDCTAITLLRGGEIELKPADDITLDEMASALFGAAVSRFRALSGWLSGRERYNPDTIVAIDRELRTPGILTFHFADGTQAKRPFTDLGSYQRIASLCGVVVIPWTEPVLSPRAAAALKQRAEHDERKRKEWAEDRRETEDRRAEE